MRIIGSLPPEKNMAFMRIAVPAISPQERAMMLGGMEAIGTGRVFNAVMRSAAKPNHPPTSLPTLSGGLRVKA